MVMRGTIEEFLRRHSTVDLLLSFVCPAVSFTLRLLFFLWSLEIKFMPLDIHIFASAAVGVLPLACDSKIVISKFSGFNC